MSFPEGFVWGAAAASYQIEGGAYDDDKGLSVWDTFCRQPGKVQGGDTGDIACDHYHRCGEDVALMADVGLKAYRLSISWPRVLPTGVGQVNPKGLDFYDGLVDTLLSRGIQPWVTLFHWDYPYALYQRGGWLNGDSPQWFAEYAQVLVDRLSDRVTHWMPLNEPQVFIDIGHRTGGHAPGLRLGLSEVLRAAHNALLSHGMAVQVIRSGAKTKPLVGTANVGITRIPADDSVEDIEAARRQMFSVSKMDCWSNAWFTDPMLLGEYPADGLALFKREMPDIGANDLTTICQPLDFQGVNIYRGELVRATRDGGARAVNLPVGHPVTTMDWPVTPECLYWGPRLFFERYNLPVVITENGMANGDWVHRDGMVHDPERIDFLARYLGQMARAIDDGVQVDGYFQWSIMDNFEWAKGYKQRFGLIHVDYATGKRTLKDSALWYREVIESNGADLAPVG